MSIPESLKQQCNVCGGGGRKITSCTLARDCRKCGGRGYTLPSQEEMAERIGALEKKVARLEAPLSDDEALDLCHASQDGWRCVKVWFPMRSPSAPLSR